LLITAIGGVPPRKLLVDLITHYVVAILDNNKK
jgi:hypothetical protein